MAQCSQPQPQEDLPFFLSLRRLTMIPMTIAARIRAIRTVPRLSVRSVSILPLPFFYSDFLCKSGGFLIFAQEQHIERERDKRQGGNESDDVEVPRERAAYLIDTERYRVGESALIADCKPG